MDPNHTTNGVKKQEDGPDKLNDTKVERRDSKQMVVKTLNRVPRACNACRKQKMRCEGAENPPCKRCRNAGLDCLFEKPSREATLTGEAGLERIRSLENHVSDIRTTQTAMQKTLQELAYFMMHHAGPPRHSSFSGSFHQHSPTMQSLSSPTSSTPPADQQIREPSVPRQVRDSMTPSYHSASSQLSGQTLPNHDTHYVIPNQSSSGSSHQPVLPPLSSLANYSAQQGGASSSRHYPEHGSSQRRLHRQQNYNPSSSSRRSGRSSSNLGSPDSSEFEGSDGLPADGLIAPFQAISGIAKRFDPESSTRSPTPERSRKKRKRRHEGTRSLPDVVTKKVITEAQARDLFVTFYHGCSTFLPVFNAEVDTFDNLHGRSAAAVNSICMVAARVRDPEGKNDLYTKCLREAEGISCSTLFAPVSGVEAVQSMILVSGWSDNGWLSGGHAVRMAMEISLHTAWPKLHKRIVDPESGGNPSEDDRKLTVASRTWFCLYLFEHQMSYGTGRQAVMRDDESLWQCRLLLQHPLAIDDDMRLVSTVELMAIRERIHNRLAPYDQPVSDTTFEVLRQAEQDFTAWYNTWDEVFAQKFDAASFYRQSLQIQHLHAELFHIATSLRGINGHDDVRAMPEAQRQLALKSIFIAQKGLELTVNSPSYREGMKYAVHYTHATATFTASYLLRLARLFPSDCDQAKIRSLVERLVVLLYEIPGKRYAMTLQFMLNGRRNRSSSSRSPRISRDPPAQNPSPIILDSTQPTQQPTQQQQQQHQQQEQQQQEQQQQLLQHVNQIGHGHPHQHQHPPENMSPMYAQPFSPTSEMHGQQGVFVPQQGAQFHPGGYYQWDQMLRGGLEAPGEPPVWMTDHSLGGPSFQQFGMDAFLIPADYAAQMW